MIDKEIEDEKKRMLHDELVTEHKKNIFIKEILSGLGEEIIKNPNKPRKKNNIFKKIKKILGWS